MVFCTECRRLFYYLSQQSSCPWLSLQFLAKTLRQCSLRQNGTVPANIQPLALGVTAASGISAELGIPLTHRGLATSVAFVTGHAREGGEDDLDETVAAAADPHTTLVVYMGLSTLPGLVVRLTAAGLPLETPAAAVERGTTPGQRTVYAQLQDLSQVPKRSSALIRRGIVVRAGRHKYYASTCELVFRTLKH